MIESIVCDDISTLTNGSDQSVIVQCPICNEHRLKRFRKILAHGHTICKKCTYKNTKEDMVGNTFGELTVLSVNGKKVTVQCSCGVVKDVHPSNIKNGTTVSCGHFARQIASERMSNAFGDKNPNWNPDKSNSNRRTRNYDSNHHYWQKAIKERDGACINCGSTENLVAHHLNGYKWFKAERYNLENGVTLCSECHNAYHSWMGGFWIKATRESFEEWFNDS